MKVEVELATEAPRRYDVRPEHPSGTLRKALMVARRRLNMPFGSYHVTWSSNFPLAAGLGASAAYCVALGRCMHQLANAAFSDDDVAQLALDLERVFHGSPSGIDSTTIAFDSPCFIKTGETFCTGLEVTRRGPLAGFIDVAPGATLVLADSGDRRETRVAMDHLAGFTRQPGGEQMIERLTALAETIALQTANALRKGDFDYVGMMVMENHRLLQALGLSTSALDSLCSVAQSSGALGAKLTGAGLGGFILAICYPDATKALVQALKRAGSPQVIVQSTDDYS
jgi:mevalonate kinase